MCDFVSKSQLFKEVDNSQLDEMNYNLWRKASIDANSPTSNDSCSPIALIDSLLVDSADSDVFLRKESDCRNESQDAVVDHSSQNFYNQHQELFSSQEDHQNDQNLLSTSPSSTVASISPPATASFTSPANEIASKLCTINMDMTYEDRVFFGVHNFYQLKSILLETQCNVDFSGPDNKVSIIGQAPNLQKMCEMFIASSTISFQIEFRFFDEKYMEFMRYSFALLHQQCKQFYKVFVSYRRTKSTSILFSFISFRNNDKGLIKAMFQLNEVFRQVGEFVPNITSSIQIPAGRRDLTGRNNMYIEQIQKQTQTKIEVHRYDECPQYPFENVIITGRSVPDVINARFQLISRFTFELKFQVFIKETRPLVEYIAKLSSDLKSTFISIEPCTDGPNLKIIAITGNEKNIGKLFEIREQLLEQVKKCNGSFVGIF